MSKIYDVVQVGYGPVSQALAMMLGRKGRSVAVVERWPSRYPLPRAVCIDHELYRVLSANGLGSVLPKVSHPAPLYQWFNAEGRELLSIDWPAESISGGPEVHFVHQPTVEEAFDGLVQTLPTVELFLGREVIKVEQFADHAAVTMRDEDGQEAVLRGRYIVGCDGANSIVRRTIGGTQEDRGFEADWLVIDVLLKDGVTIEQLGIPPAGQFCDPERPTTIVPAGVREGRTFRRWEFFRMPGERNEDLEDEATVWRLLSKWAGPEDIELVRHKIYNFRSLLAEKWRDGRLLIAGDAAHVMPPFMGQGMCSGLRDVWNLAWKLELVLDGKADDRLLDTYQPERKPHVGQIIDISIHLGKIICIPDPEVAAERDRTFFAGEAPPPPDFPHLIDGLLRRTADGAVQAGAGLLSPHAQVRAGGQQGRFDDVVGAGFKLVGLGFDPAARLDPETRDSLRQIGLSTVALTEEGVVDLDDKFAPFMRAHGMAAMVVRPDFYVYGSSPDAAGVAALVADLGRDLAQSGVVCLEALPA